MSLCVIIDCGSGNLRSVAKALERAAVERNDDCRISITASAEDLRKADRIVLPGVGAFRACRNGLDALQGMQQALQDEVIARGKPFLGICVGMQLMADVGREHEVTDGLGWIAGEVRELTPADPSLKIPHMGWNTLEALGNHPVLNGLRLGPSGQHAYFVHSYALNCAQVSDCLAVTDYGGPVTAMVARDNLVGTQFHPEKSQALGLTLLGNFLEWRP